MSCGESEEHIHFLRTHTEPSLTNDNKKQRTFPASRPEKTGTKFRPFRVDFQSPLLLSTVHKWNDAFF